MPFKSSTYQANSKKSFFKRNPVIILSLKSLNQVKQDMERASSYQYAKSVKDKMTEYANKISPLEVKRSEVEKKMNELKMVSEMSETNLNHLVYGSKDYGYNNSKLQTPNSNLQSTISQLQTINNSQTISNIFQLPTIHQQIKHIL